MIISDLVVATLKKFADRVPAEDPQTYQDGWNDGQQVLAGWVVDQLQDDKPVRVPNPILDDMPVAYIQTEEENA